MSEITPFDFQGKTVRTTIIDGEPWFVLADVAKVLCYQQTKDARKHVRGTQCGLADRETGADLGFHSGSMPTLITEGGLYRLIMKSQCDLADDFQDHVTDVILPTIRKTGGYISPTASADQLAVIIANAQAQAAVLQLAKGLVDPVWLETKARHVIARALGEEPEVDPASRPLTVGEFLDDKGVDDAGQRAMSSGFGKRLKALFFAEYGTEPGRVQRFVSGRPTMVNAYTETHRPLFETVWSNMN